MHKKKKYALMNSLNNIARLPYCHSRMQFWNSSMPKHKIFIFPPTTNAKQVQSASTYSQFQFPENANRIM
jgi:hypothetical protein